VVISTAHGLKFSDFKTAYHDRRLEGINSRYANPPVLLPPNYGAVMDTIHTHLKVRT
jgi:threonine synthase